MAGVTAVPAHPVADMAVAMARVARAVVTGLAAVDALAAPVALVARAAPAAAKSYQRGI